MSRLNSDAHNFLKASSEATTVSVHWRLHTGNYSTEQSCP